MAVSIYWRNMKFIHLMNLVIFFWKNAIENISFYLMNLVSTSDQSLLGPLVSKSMLNALLRVFVSLTSCMNTCGMTRCAKIKRKFKWIRFEIKMSNFTVKIM